MVGPYVRSDLKVGPHSRTSCSDLMVEPHVRTSWSGPHGRTSWSDLKVGPQGRTSWSDLMVGPHGRRTSFAMIIRLFLIFILVMDDAYSPHKWASKSPVCLWKALISHIANDACWPDPLEASMHFMRLMPQRLTGFAREAYMLTTQQLKWLNNWVKLKLKWKGIDIWNLNLKI